MAKHYFATHALGYARSKVSVDDAIEQLCLKNTDSKWVTRCAKSGEPLTIFACCVPVAFDDKYRILGYAPEVEGLTETGNYIVTYLSKTKYAVMRDPRDEVFTLNEQIKNLAAAIREHKSYHTPELRLAIVEAGVGTAEEDAEVELNTAA